MVLRRRDPCRLYFNYLEITTIRNFQMLLQKHFLWVSQMVLILFVREIYIFSLSIH